MSSQSTQAVVPLYRSLLRMSKNFGSYNFREYALRRVRDGFQAHRAEKDLAVIEQLVLDGKAQLELLQRQTTISKMYEFNKTVVETQPSIKYA
ncbi:complex 1 protein-domain-containing protein [Lipomyces japonicus]|uniref:complex 1 protein-domain-containing protein n=1 Tax=Lipomyces japonicus TaxID=56871 RepID=UPI0034CD5C60